MANTEWLKSTREALTEEFFKRLPYGSLVRAVFFSPNDLESLARCSAIYVEKNLGSAAEFGASDVKSSALAEFQDSLKEFAQRPSILIDYNLDIDKALDYLKKHRPHPIEGNRVNMLHDAMLKSFLTEYLNKAVTLPAFQVELWRALL